MRLQGVSRDRSARLSTSSGRLRLAVTRHASRNDRGHAAATAGVLNAIDPDGDRVGGRRGSGAGHAPCDSSSNAGGYTTPNVAPETAFRLASDPTEDTRYCWRVRSDDGPATSAYHRTCFVASKHDVLPNMPALDNPSDDMAATTTARCSRVRRLTDAEGESITCEIEVNDEPAPGRLGDPGQRHRDLDSAKLANGATPAGARGRSA